MMIRTVFFLCLFWFSAKVATAQIVEHWSLSNELKSNIINSGRQDGEGFVWFATTNGLSRYNGHSFDHFDQSVLDNLCSDNIRAICIHKNELWIGSDNHGISVLDLESYAIVRNYTAKDELPSNRIMDLLATKDGEIWMATWEGYIGWSKGQGAVQFLKDSEGNLMKVGSSPKIARDQKCLYSVAENGARYKINLKTKAYALIGEHLKASEHFSVTSLETSGAVFCSPNGVYPTNEAAIDSEVFAAIKDEEVFYVLKDKGESHWIVQDDRRKLVRIQKGLETDFSARIFESKNNVHVNDLLEDASQNIWVSTTNGIYKISNESHLFSSILTFRQVAIPEYIPSFRGMTQDAAGALYFGGYNGLFALKKDGSLQQLFGNTIPYSPYRILEKNLEELWVISEGYGVLTVHKSTGEVRVHENNLNSNQSVKGLYLQSGILAKDGDFWLGSYEGVLRYSPKKNRYYKPALYYQGEDIGAYSCRDIWERKNGTVLLGTLRGVFVVDSKGKPIAHYHSKASGKYKIPFDDINVVRESSEGKLIFGSRTKGVVIVSGEQSKSITMDQGLTDNGVASIELDASGRIWIATNHGISCYSPEKDEIRNYFEENGISDNEFNHASSFVDKEGTLYFGGVNGINIYNGKAQGARRKKAQLSISKLEYFTGANQRTHLYSNASVPGEIVLPYDQAFVNFEFFLNDYLRPDQHKYFYYIEGFTKDWEVLDENRLRLTALSSGRYEVRIKAVSSTGIPASNELVIPIVIEGVFYKSWWFLTLLVVLTIGTVVYVSRQRIRRLKALDLMRRKIAADLHDDVGSTLTRIAMQSEILEEEVTNEQKRTVKSIATGSREAMANMRNMIWSIDSRNSKVVNLFDKLSEFAGSIFDDADVEYTLEMDDEIQSFHLSPIQKQEVFMVFKEAVNNALKHGDGTAVHINLRSENRKFMLSVKNQASDYGNEKQIAGSGLANMRERAKKMNADLYVYQGEEFELKIVLQSARYKLSFRK